MNEQINDSMATSRLEQSKQDQTFNIYNTQRGRELAEFEADIANSQLRLEKRKEDSTVTIAVERLRANREIPDDLRTALSDLDRARETVGMTHENTPERTQAEQAVQTADQNLQTERQNLRNQGMTDAQITQHEGNSLNRLQRTRYFAIINKRAYADAQDDASSNAPTSIANSIINGDSMGPFEWNQQDAIDFFNNQRTSSAEATLGLSTKMASLQINLKDSRTMGHALQGYSHILNTANQGFLNEGTNRVWDRMDGGARQHILTIARAQTNNNALQRIDAQTLERLVLDTNGDMQQRGFATSIINELQMADNTGGFAQIDPATGQPIRDAQGNIVVAVAGSSGIGRNVAGFVERL